MNVLSLPISAPEAERLSVLRERLRALEDRDISCTLPGSEERLLKYLNKKFLELSVAGSWAIAEERYFYVQGGVF